ncbi:MAG: multiheme c-type cytochrome, partial [Gemmatimonadaceae bacterium]
MTASNYAALKSAEWRKRLLHCVAGLLVFETLTGLAIYLLPFSVTNQMMVLFHTAAGLAFVAPFAWYQARHWKIYRSIRLSHVVLTGYFAMAATIVLIVSGLVLTWQAAFGTRIGPVWDQVHVWSTFALVAATVPHVLTMMARAVRVPMVSGGGLVRAASRSFTFVTVLLSTACFAGVAFAVGFYRAPQLVNELPADYSYVFGKDRPFAPSLARTGSGGAIDSRSLAGSQSCGTSNCHKQIYDEWAPSAHRYAAMDPAFQAVQNEMAKQNGPESTRYCAGCHDPISLFSGEKNIFNDSLTSAAGYDEGVSCVSCHAIKETDVKGNAAYVMSQPRRYVGELGDGPVSRAVSEFLIRAYPEYHIETLQHKLFKSPEFCAACHKQFIDEEINRVGWVQLQNQYDNWRKSRWNHPGDAHKTIECRECHMPLEDSTDPAAGDALDYNRTVADRKHRSHRFIGANQAIPALLGLPGAGEQVRLVERWLKGEYPIPEIAHKWTEGPAVALELVCPPEAAPGESVTVRAVITSNKVGHDFPTGPLDIIQSWVELTVADPSGRQIFASGHRDPRHFIEPGTFMFKAEPVDQYGNLIDRHNLWEMVGVRYRRALFPGFSDTAEYNFRCSGNASRGGALEGRTLSFEAPAGGAPELRVQARLLYRKVDQYLLNFMFGEKA